MENTKQKCQTLILERGGETASLFRKFQFFARSSFWWELYKNESEGKGIRIVTVVV
jgi:hypothetical protein